MSILVNLDELTPNDLRQLAYEKEKQAQIEEEETPDFKATFKEDTYFLHTGIFEDGDLLHNLVEICEDYRDQTLQSGHLLNFNPKQWKEFQKAIEWAFKQNMQVFKKGQKAEGWENHDGTTLWYIYGKEGDLEEVTGIDHLLEFDGQK